jgi:adenosylcobinamide amidohydrolase
VIEVEHHGQTLVWRPPAPVWVASTSVVGGGIGLRRWFLNMTVDKDYDGDPGADLRRQAAALGLAGDGVGMMTAKDVREAVTTTDGGVDVVATVGLGWPVWAAAADEPLAARPGTINLLVAVPVRLDDGALVNAVATATEAKAQALLEAGVAGTGTASDAVCVACPTIPPDGGPVEAYGGPRSVWGARVARAVHQAVRQGTR